MRGTRSHRPGAPLFLEGSLVAFSKPMIIRSVGLRVTHYGGSTPPSRGQSFFTATSSPLDDERDNNSRHSDGSQSRHQHQRSISCRGHKASTCFFAWGVEHRQFNRTRPGIGGINPQRAFDRHGHLGLRGCYLLNVQSLGRNRYRTFALKGGVALGCRDFLDGIDARVHAGQFHMAIRARGDARVGIRRPRVVGR